MTEGIIVVVAVRGGNAHKGKWLPGGVLIPECKQQVTRTNYTWRTDLEVDCPQCLSGPLVIEHDAHQPDTCRHKTIEDGDHTQTELKKF